MGHTNTRAAPVDSREINTIGDADPQQACPLTDLNRRRIGDHQPITLALAHQVKAPVP